MRSSTYTKIAVKELEEVLLVKRELSNVDCLKPFDIRAEERQA